MATIEVLLPVYNAASTLPATLKSLSSQTFRDFRVIIVDDGSTDQSRMVAEEFARSDERFVSVWQENTGIVGALNAAILMTSSDFLARIDADDLCHSQRFEIQVEYLRSHPDVVAVSGQARYIDGEGKALPGKTQHHDTDSDYCSIPAKEPYLMHPFLMIRGRVLRRLRYRDVPHAEDTDLYWRAREIGTLANLREIVGAYRVHSGSISSRSLLNGRVQAVASQLAAVSAKRRADRRSDYVFDAALKQRLEASESLASMVTLASVPLTAEEGRYLAISSAFKLIETSHYRPYELDLADLEFARSLLEQVRPALNTASLNHLDWAWVHYGASLLRQGRIRRARDLFTFQQLSRAAIDAAKDAVRRRLV